MYGDFDIAYGDWFFLEGLQRAAVPKFGYESPEWACVVRMKLEGFG